MTAAGGAGPHPGDRGPSAPPVCYRHTDRETYIRCQRCDRPICPDCMVPASVGFQCPECVREGTRSTRQGRATYGGKRSEDPRLTSFVLIALNLAVFVAITVTGRGDSQLVDYLGLRPIGGTYNTTQGLMDLPGMSTGAYWQVLTTGFTQYGLFHLAANVLSIYVFGPEIERVLGRARYLAVYVGSMVGASGTVMLFSHPNGLTLGASGAVFGLMGALVVFGLKLREQLQPLAILIGANVVFTFVVPNISWQGHLGGLATGVVLTAAIVWAPRAHRSLLQWSAVGAVTVLWLVVIALRAAALA